MSERGKDRPWQAGRVGLKESEGFGERVCALITHRRSCAWRRDVLLRFAIEAIGTTPRARWTRHTSTTTRTSTYAGHTATLLLGWHPGVRLAGFNFRLGRLEFALVGNNGDGGLIRFLILAVLAIPAGVPIRVPPPGLVARRPEWAGAERRLGILGRHLSRRLLRLLRRHPRRLRLRLLHRHPSWRLRARRWWKRSRHGGELAGSE